MRRFGWLLLGVVLLAGLLGLGAVLAWLSGGSPGGPWPGTTVGLRSSSPGVAFGDWLEEERLRAQAQEIPIVGRFETVTVTAGELGLELDVSATLARARATRSHGGFRRLRNAYLALVGKLDLEPVMRLDQSQAHGVLSRLNSNFFRAPVDARLDIAGHRRIRAQAGERLDVPRMVEWLAAQTGTQGLTVPAILELVAPAITDAMLANVDVARVLSSYESDFRTHAGPRAINIRRAAKALDEVVVPPGGIVSFNQLVGPRLLERGFQMAPVIVEDELEPGVGGGVCQVASTLHAAAVMGGIEVVSRRSHSRPSGYVPLGLDATVLDGEVDLKLKNAYSVPLIIHTKFPSPYRIRFEFLGMDPPADFRYTYGVTKRHETYRRVVTHPELSAGTQNRKQKGSLGYDVVSAVTAKYPDGRTAVHRYSSKYYPVPEVIWVGPDVPVSSLPPLPEGAVAITWDGATISGELPEAAARRLGSPAPPVDEGLLNP